MKEKNQKFNIFLNRTPINKPIFNRTSTSSSFGFCQATRLQYLNGQIDLANQNVLQQQHVDFKIANALLKKGTREAYKTWTQQDRAIDFLEL